MPLFWQKWLEQAVFWPHSADAEAAAGAAAASGAKAVVRVFGVKTISEPTSSNANLNLLHLR